MKTGYMCLTDFKWELGEASGGCEVYKSIEDLKKHRKCVVRCGIVKVSVKLEQVISDHNWKGEDL